MEGGIGVGRRMGKGECVRIVSVSVTVSDKRESEE